MIDSRLHLRGAFTAALAVLAAWGSAATPLAGQDDRLREDWASLARYREANARLGPPRPGEQRVVFYGNSITDVWARYFDTMFPNKSYVGRGIGGQTTPPLVEQAIAAALRRRE